ncbi:protein serine/threonine phosphatase 2C, partial [Trichocladium antarcticum]
PSASPPAVDRLLSQHAYSCRVPAVPGVARYDGAQLPANSPCEDRVVHGRFASPRADDGRGGGGDWMAWGLFDGHAGPQTAEVLERELLSFVRRELVEEGEAAAAAAAPAPEGLGTEAVRRAVGRGFVALDGAIVGTAAETAREGGQALEEKVRRLMPAYAGSCALLSLYDPVESTLHVACTGDSRAVMGRRRADGTWEAVALSVDQTGANPDEVARLRREHPGEDKIVDGSEKRVLGLMVSRAFGDGRWKWPLDLQADLKQRFYGPSPLAPKYPVQTPPYLTAEPVVTATRMDPATPSFLIMATDGMWDSLSNQQAVDLVARWMDADAAEKTRYRMEDADYEPFDFGRFRDGVDWRFVEARTTVQDNNAAVHLMRNSLGGNHQELIAGRLAYSPPFARRVRDDITVQVVFF